MKVIDWNQPSSFVDLFENISISCSNNNRFNLNNPTWISHVTDNFGECDEIANNLLILFKINVHAIRCYHATRLFFPKKIYREGLKKLSEKLIVKICRQAGYSPNKKEKEIIFARYHNYNSIMKDGTRNNIYVQLDKYRDMLCEESNTPQHNCSFFDGGEVFGNVLPNTLSSQLLKVLKTRGIPTLISIDLPLSNKYLNDNYIVKIANTFFCSWFNLKVLNGEPFPNTCGLNIPLQIKGEYVKDILLFPN
ncbi:hypothetical protein ELY21_12070 [Legionella sp. km535]|uniref:hypothetical protein n=1 Tax=Legionella sp. km535 TaxID=2498107 RepID=UPI000F8E683A|nr:hypothetical protein [Legionella sp. km535]RUR16983.1 hypothetical protein ELY21_12070 [Legionella sp. km535]